MALTPPNPFAPPPPPPALPAASADCVTTVQPAQPGAPAQQFAHSMARSADGKMRVDYGATSVISDPATGKMMVLDHLKKEVRTLPIPPAAPSLPAPPRMAIPGAPAPSAAPPPPGMTVKDLGKRVVEGHEVDGKQFTLIPPAVPKPPAAPAPPGMPQVPGAPQAPGTPAAPEAPKAAVPLVTEVWTSSQLQIPVLTRITGAFGKQTCHCKNLSGSPPSPSLFQVPPGYKPV